MKPIFIFLVAFFLSCGSSPLDEGEDYGDLLQGPEGLELTEEEHVEGWGNPNCTLCHNLQNIHLVNRTNLPIDIEAIYNKAIEDGNEGCAVCHGTNGVP